MAFVAQVHLLHWNTGEDTLSIGLNRCGYDVSCHRRPDQSVLRKLRQSPPDAIAIDLSRLPSHGREFAIALRKTKTTRHIPIVFKGGEPVKIAAIRAQLPDAFYIAPDRMAGAVEKAIADAPATPVVPIGAMDRFAGRTAAQKLGIREGSIVGTIEPPRDYATVIGALPDEAAIEEVVPAKCDVVLWFVYDAAVYREGLLEHRELARRAKLWILWRKGKRGATPDLNERTVRESALAAGLVDYKICSVNATWSGLLFARK